MPSQAEAADLPSPRRRVPRAALALLALALAALGLYLAIHRPFPSDKTPEGAYMRIARDLGKDQVKDAFPYLETEAQWASYTLRDARKKALERILGSYPEPERTRLSHAYRPLAEAPDGSDAFALVARERGWDRRLRRDLSGVTSVEQSGERASVVTARGTRYPFRRRDNGIWGLTLFTADLVAEAERATRDLALVEKAADDYERAKK